MRTLQKDTTFAARGSCLSVSSLKSRLAAAHGIGKGPATGYPVSEMFAARGIADTGTRQRADPPATADRLLVQASRGAGYVPPGHWTLGFFDTLQERQS